jgi:auxin efflux carrier family
MLKGESENSIEVQSKEEEAGETRPERKMRILIILMKVGKKLIMNPNTYATFIGLIWSSIHFRQA